MGADTLVGGGGCADVAIQGVCHSYRSQHAAMNALSKRVVRRGACALVQSGLCFFYSLERFG